MVKVESKFYFIKAKGHVKSSIQFGYTKNYHNYVRCELAEMKSGVSKEGYK